MRIAIALLVALAAGTVFAQQPGYLVQAVPSEAPPVPLAAQYQTLTIKEPRVTWTPSLDYVDRDIQVNVPVQQLAASIPSVSVPTLSTVASPTLSLAAVPTLSAAPSASDVIQYQIVNQPCTTCPPAAPAYQYTMTAPTVSPVTYAQTVIQDPIPQLKAATYRPAMVCQNGQCTQIDVPVRGILKLRRLLRTNNNGPF